MTIASTNNKSGPYVCDGVTVAFPVTFGFIAAADLVVTETDTATGVDTVKTLGTSYTVAGGGTPPATGTVTAVTAPPAGKTWTLSRSPSPVQAVPFKDLSSFPGVNVETALDLLTMLVQKHDDALSRALVASVSESGPFTFPPLVTRKGNYFGFDLVTGAPIALSVIAAGTTVSGAMQPVVQAATLALARTALQLGTLALLAGDLATQAQVDSATAGGHLVTADLLASRLPHGQCRLTKSGANLLLSPFAGNKLVINGRVCTIADAGVTLAIGAAVASTTYYIYAFSTVAGAADTLEFSTTVPVAQAGTGVLIKTGDATRTLVGMARANATPAWADTAAQRFVLSYFNRRGIAAGNVFAANRTANTGAIPTFIEVSSTERAEFLTWGDEEVSASCAGVANAGAANPYTAIGFDGVTPEEGFCTGPGSSFDPAVVTVLRTGLSEGYHYATILASGSSAMTTTYFGTASPGTRCAIGAVVRG